MLEQKVHLTVLVLVPCYVKSILVDHTKCFLKSLIRCIQAALLLG